MSTVTFSPITAMMQNSPPGTIITGRSGAGKTFFLTNIAANSLLTNCRVICIDPKNDLSVLKRVYPFIKLTDINNISPGALNPFKVLKTIDTNVLLSIISCICGDLDDSKIVAITPIINDFVLKKNKYKEEVDFSTLANYLYGSDNLEAQAIGTLLKANADSKYGPLLFGQSKDEGIRIGEHSEIISLFGMQLPKNTGKSLTQEERFSSGIIYILCKMLREILTGDNKVPTVLIIDEAHILFSNNSITDIIDTFLVLGRSLNVATVLASQNISHFPDGLNQFSTKITFNMSNSEVKEFLRAFDDSSSSSPFDREMITEKIANLKTGHCFMIDSKNRGGFVRVTSNLGDITTNPLFKKRE